jgi:RND superfamily putative drug exporter
MFVIGSDIFNSIASGTITVVLCAVVGSVTVLPAVLELLGPRIDRGRVPFLPHLKTEPGESRFWPAVVDRVLRRPALSCALATAVLLALALPLLWISVAKPSDDSLASQGEPALATLAHVRSTFESMSAPAIVVAGGPPERNADVIAAIGRLEQLAEGRGLVHPPFRTSSSPDGSVVAVELPLSGFGSNDESRHALDVLREQLIPVTLGRVPDVETVVTGDTAEDVDFTDQMTHGMPYVIAFVLAFAFVLLLIAFRSIVVPLKAIVLNLLSVAAAYGVLVLVFQHSWAEGILGFESNGSIVSWLPPFLFVVLFGLSMDYHVFILSRVREGFDAGMPSDVAVRHGITATAGVVTSAALVMVGVFSIFGTLSSLDVKQAGVGLAAAVLIDATIVRAVLLPSSMHLLGEWNWYLPKALGRFARRPPAASESA